MEMGFNIIEIVENFLDIDWSRYEFLIKIALAVLACLIFYSIVRFAERKLKIWKHKRHRKQIHRDVRKLSNTVSEMTPQTFFQLRNTSYGGQGRRHISSSYDFAGIYILFNHTKNMYYVGQGVQLFQRVNNHFTGHGNGDVYADYKYGDDFTIKLIPLAGSGFRTLNELERRAIHDYGAYARGYNKTRGNRG